MQKKTKILIPLFLAGGLGVFYFFNRKARSAANLSYEPAKIAIDSAKTLASFGTSLYYNITLKIINNDIGAVNVRGVNLAGFANGRKVGTIINNARINIPGRATINAVFTLRLNIVNVGASVYRAIKDGEQFTIALKGIINTDLGELVIDFQKNVDF